MIDSSLISYKVQCILQQIQSWVKYTFHKIDDDFANDLVLATEEHGQMREQRKNNCFCLHYICGKCILAYKYEKKTVYLYIKYLIFFQLSCSATTFNVKSQN